MTSPLEITFTALAVPHTTAAIVLVGQDLALGEVGRELDHLSRGALLKAAAAADFKGRSRSSIELLAAPGLETARLILVGAGNPAEAKADDWAELGGYCLGQLAARKGTRASLVVDIAEGEGAKPGVVVSEIALGALLRHYKFRKYVKRKPEPANGGGNGEAEPSDGLTELIIQCQDPDAARAAFVKARAVANGVVLARELVNEPANALGPVEFADRIRELQSVGVDVEVLDGPALEALGMGALLAVAQGSARPARVAVMQWHGAKARRGGAGKGPLCFIGKGVVFDTGGISMKPAAGMEEMKGDMAGAACVTGLMHALAERKAAVNAVGVVGLVENMPSSTATRPGDIVTSMSGQTIEVLNTDAEGRLVLADVIHYAQDRFKPRLIIDLATLTGAIIVALGKEHAGLFANDDKLAAELLAAGEAVGEKVWRMPLGKAYDKLIDSKAADMKNIGGRWGGAITGAQFIARFVPKDTPWAHLDIAGVAMDSNKTEISQGWASGWGVRLLDRLVRDGYEKA